jgi:hypothetical protein
MDGIPGDELVVNGSSGRDERIGLILGVRDIDGHAAYLVHWVVGDYDSLVSPWPAVRVRHRDSQTPAA